MNFPFVGFALIIVNIHLSMWVTYAVKALGFVLAAVGIAEYSIHDKGVKAFAPNAVATAIMNGVFTAALIYASIKLGAKYVNYIGIVCGVVSTGLSLDFQRRMMESIMRSGVGKVVEDQPSHKSLLPFVADINRLGKAWKRLTGAVMLNLIFDIVNRLIGLEIVQTAAGVLAAASKIVCIVFAIAFLFRFNELRVGYERTMDKLDNT